MTDMIYVKSSNIDAISHDGKKLRVKFKSGGVYEYDDVTDQEFTEFAQAESPGKYFIANIKNAKTSRKIDVMQLVEEEAKEKE